MFTECIRCLESFILGADVRQKEGGGTVNFLVGCEGVEPQNVSSGLLQVTGVAVSSRHPYMFSCGLDKMVKCWDLETNKVSTTLFIDAHGSINAFNPSKYPCCSWPIPVSKQKPVIISLILAAL